jgi:hypothetical protein
VLQKSPPLTNKALCIYPVSRSRWIGPTPALVLFFWFPACWKIRFCVRNSRSNAAVSILGDNRQQQRLHTQGAQWNNSWPQEGPGKQDCLQLAFPPPPESPAFCVMLERSLILVTYLLCHCRPPSLKLSPAAPTKSRGGAEMGLISQGRS